MKTLKKETLMRIVEEFPSFTWDQKVLEELVDPKLGVITAFGEILSEIETLMSFDLGEIGLTSEPNQEESDDG